jgi:hypothetical protein
MPSKNEIKKVTPGQLLSSSAQNAIIERVRREVSGPNSYEDQSGVHSRRGPRAAAGGPILALRIFEGPTLHVQQEGGEIPFFVYFYRARIQQFTGEWVTDMGRTGCWIDTADEVFLWFVGVNGDLPSYNVLTYMVFMGQYVGDTTGEFPGPIYAVTQSGPWEIWLYEPPTDLCDEPWWT